MLIPNGCNYPINIQAKTEPRVAGFSEGYQQRSSFEPLRSSNLNYLGLSKLESDQLLLLLDSAGGVDAIEWGFRPHYFNKWWLVSSVTNIIHDKNRLEEISFDITEYPRGLPGYIAPLGVTPLIITPDRSPVITRQYGVRKPQLGFFFDQKKELINPVTELIRFDYTTDHETADLIDMTLSRCRGVYPLGWEGGKYTCSDWSINYETEFATVELTLQTIN